MTVHAQIWNWTSWSLEVLMAVLTIGNGRSDAFTKTHVSAWKIWAKTYMRTI